MHELKQQRPTQSEDLLAINLLAIESRVEIILGWQPEALVLAPAIKTSQMHSFRRPQV
jgi:hypothetical protein